MKTRANSETTPFGEKIVPDQIMGGWRVAGGKCRWRERFRTLLVSPPASAVPAVFVTVDFPPQANPLQANPSQASPSMSALYIFCSPQLRLSCSVFASRASVPSSECRVFLQRSRSRVRHWRTLKKDRHQLSLNCGPEILGGILPPPDEDRQSKLTPREGQRVRLRSGEKNFIRIDSSRLT